MTIENIEHSLTVESVNSIGLKSWRKFGLSIKCTDTDDTQKAKEYAVSIVEKWHNESLGKSMQPEHWNSQQNVQSDNFGQSRLVPRGIFYNVPEEKPTEEQAIDGHIEAINLCRSIKALGYFEKMVINNEAKHPRLREAYDNKLKSLL